MAAQICRQVNMTVLSPPTSTVEHSTWIQLLPRRTLDFMKTAEERQVSLKKTQSLSSLKHALNFTLRD
jgi:hypothetical protein